jgi:hypothetical protein
VTRDPRRDAHEGGHPGATPSSDLAGDPEGRTVPDSDSLTVAQLARAAAALDVWFTNPGGSDYRHPDRVWDSAELAAMHAALEAPNLDAALVVFGVEPGTWLSTPEQDAANRSTMAELRAALSALTADS